MTKLLHAMVHSLLSNSRQHHETQNATQPAGFHCLGWRCWTKLVESDEGLKQYSSKSTQPSDSHQAGKSDEGLKHNTLPKAHNQLTFTMLEESDEGVKHNVLPKAHNQLTVSGKDQTNE